MKPEITPAGKLMYDCVQAKWVGDDAMKTCVMAGHEMMIVREDDTNPNGYTLRYMGFKAEYSSMNSAMGDATVFAKQILRNLMSQIDSIDDTLSEEGTTNRLYQRIANVFDSAKQSDTESDIPHSKFELVELLRQLFDRIDHTLAALGNANDSNDRFVDAYTLLNETETGEFSYEHFLILLEIVREANHLLCSGPDHHWRTEYLKDGFVANFFYQGTNQYKPVRFKKSRNVIVMDD